MHYSRIFFLAFTLNFCFLTATELSEDVLTFWFTELQSPEDYPEERSKIWFNASAEVDQEIRDRFEYLLLLAKNNELSEWKKTPRGRLALILLVDQFSRNMYRGTPEAFAFDDIARQLALEGIKNGEDLELYPVERIFFYLPLEHAEDLSIQELSIDKFYQLADEAPSFLTEVFNSYAKYAQAHYDTIYQFGRFPTRNAILNRKSTQEEILFLQE